MLKSKKTVTLLGGGEFNRDTLVFFMKFSSKLCVADGAADRALDEGFLPDLVIGDFDSISQRALKEIPQERQLHISEQDSTDFEKCITHIEAPLIYGVGFTGARIDHELAVYHVLVRYPGKRVVVIGSEDICLHAPRSLRLSLEPGTRVSLFPMAAVTGRSTGLRWPIEGLKFAPDRQIGTSNEAVEAEITLEFDGPGMLLILPRAVLPELERGLRDAEPHGG